MVRSHSAASVSRITYLLLAFILPQLLSIGPTSVSAQSELLAHWRFDEGSGTTIADASGNGHHGTVQGGTWVDAFDLASLDPHALALSGSSSYADTTDFDINNDFTFSAWIKPASGENGAILAKHDSGGGNFIVFGIYGGQIHLRIRNDAMNVPAPFINTWQHVVVVGKQVGTAPATDVWIYVNQTLMGYDRLATTVDDVSNGRPWTIGQDWDGNTRTDFYHGVVDDIRIYSAGLSDAEIAAIAEEFHAQCFLDPDDPATVTLAAGSGACDEILLSAGDFPATTAETAGNLTIRGAGRDVTYVTVERTASQQFLLNFDHNIHLEDMTIKGTRYKRKEMGGAVYNRGILTAERVHFTNNSTPGLGASVSNLGEATFTDVEFSYSGRDVDGAGGVGSVLFNRGTAVLNRTQFRANLGRQGVAIHNEGQLNVLESSFLFNTAESGCGAAIFNIGTLEIGQSEFIRNDASTGGAAICNGNSENASVTVRDSQVISNTAGGGGAIRSDGGTFELISSTIVGNTSTGGQAGIYHVRGTMTVQDSVVSENSADSFGGGISNRGTMRIMRTTISDNYGGDGGGGIMNEGNGAEMEIIASTISGNSGGGLLNRAVAVLTNSTVSGNSLINDNTYTQMLAAGIHQLGAGSDQLTLNHVTISDNVAPADYAQNLNVGGGRLDVFNTLIIGSGSGAPNCLIRTDFTTVTQAGNLSNDASCSGFGEAPTATVLPLANNGGPTWTHALPKESPAIGSGVPIHCAELDQRGASRKARCDIGAYEFDGTTQTYLPFTVQ